LSREERHAIKKLQQEKRKSTQNELAKALLLLSLTRKIQLDDREKYKPLPTPMAVETHKKVNQLISNFNQENLMHCR